MSATASSFEEQMRHLSERYHVVSLPEVLDAQQGRSPLPPRAVLLTFDDAYCDFRDVAWPILKSFGLSASVCVPTGFPDHPERRFWWDRLHHAFARTTRHLLHVEAVGSIPLTDTVERRAGLKRIERHILTLPNGDAELTVDALCADLGLTEEYPPSDVLPWSDLRALAAEGVSLVAHTRNHAALTNTDGTTLRTEIRGSIADIERAAGSAVTAFCYPYGFHDDRVVKEIRHQGIEMAFTSLDGHNGIPSPDPLRLRRTVITPRTTPLVFGLRLLRAVSYVDMWRHRSKQAQETSGVGGP